MTTITNTPATVNCNGYNVVGREWVVNTLTPSETGTDADNYLARNTGKTRTIYAFLGIEYAQQPVGPKRFKPAVKKAPSANIDASQFGSVAPQGYSEESTDTGQGRTEFGVEEGLAAWGALGTREGEDCLNLNIYSPTLNSNSTLPVCVWFHGGGGNYLSSVDRRIAGHRLATKGVIHVTVEYRLGNLGHYYLPSMEGEGDYETVNFSLTDAVAALNWVKDHISDFGGDPNNVTIAGGSFGGNIVHCLVHNPATRSLFHKFASSSASAGFDKRVQEEYSNGSKGYKDYFGERQTLIEGIASKIRDSQDPTRTLEAAIADVGYNTAIREHLSLSDFLSIDAGRTGIYINEANTPVEGYSATRGVTIMNDGATCFYESNRAAALAGAYPSTHPALIGVCQFEASVAGGTSGRGGFFAFQLRNLANGLTTNSWARSSVFSTEYTGAAASPAWANLDFTNIQIPWDDFEPNAQIFSQGYQHAAYCAARAVEDAGADAYLYWWNYRSSGVSGTTIRAIHTSDEPYLLGNTLWDLDSTGSNSIPEPITTQDIYMGDKVSQFFANFCKHGNPNTEYSYPQDFSLFAPSSIGTMVAFDPSDKNWNVFGTNFRSANNSTATVTSTNDHGAHFWDYLDSRLGV